MTHFKRYLTNWSEDKSDSFWCEIINGIFSIPRALLFFGIPLFITVIIIRILEFFAILKMPRNNTIVTIWTIVFSIPVFYAFGRWLEK